MVEVSTTVSHVNIYGDRGRGNGGMGKGVEVTCDRCGHSEFSFGEGPVSVRRCAALLRENCPRGERNFYQTNEDPD